MKRLVIAIAAAVWAAPAMSQESQLSCGDFLALDQEQQLTAMTESPAPAAGDKTGGPNTAIEESLQEVQMICAEDGEMTLADAMEQAAGE